MTILLALFGKYRLQIAALLLIALALSFAWSKAVSHGEARSDARWEKKEKAAEAQARKLESELAGLSTKAGTDARDANVRIVTRTKTLIERIPADVPKGSPADVSLGAGWLRNYNDSLQVQAPGLAGRAPSEPSLPASDALAAIDLNNSACLQEHERAERLVQFYDSVRAKANGK